MNKIEKAKQTMTRPPSSKLTHSFQIKLIDLCTEHQGTYFRCEDLADFWAEVAHSLGREFPFPITEKDVEEWVKGICHEAKECLLRREIFPHRAGREDLDIAIEDWLEIEGRRKFQHGFAEMITGYLFAYSPEESEEANLLTHSCLHRLRENRDKVKTVVSGKGEASRRKGALLIRKVELLTSQLGTGSTRQALTPEPFNSRICGSPHRNPISTPDSNLKKPHGLLPGHAGAQHHIIGSSTTNESVGEGSPSVLSRFPTELSSSHSRAIRFSPKKSPEIHTHPTSPSKNDIRRSGTAGGVSSTHFNPVEEPTSPVAWDGNRTLAGPEAENVVPQGFNPQASRQSILGPPAIKRSVLEPGGAKRARVQKGKGADRSRPHPRRRDSSLLITHPSVPSTSSTAHGFTTIGFGRNTQGQQQAKANEEPSQNSHPAGQEYAKALATNPSTMTQKVKKTKGAVKKQTLANKRHLEQSNTIN